MSIYITPQDELHVEPHGITLRCPHCQALAHVTAMGVPRFAELTHRKPRNVGVVLRCDACGDPVFLRFPARSYNALRIELAATYTQIERAVESFPLSYLPQEAEELFKEALGCYSAGCFNAFAAMSRRTAQSLFRELGERGKLDLFDALQDIRSLAELDDDSFAVVRAVLFGSDNDPWPHQPRLDAQRGGVLLEVMRDLLYQTFVRKARLVQAMTFRKYVSPQVETGT